MFNNLLIIILLFPFFSVAGENVPSENKHGERGYIAYTVNNNSWLSITGTTSINSFECFSSSGLSNGYILTETNRHHSKINITDARILVEVNSFDCKNPLLNRDMHNSLGGNENPDIEIKLLDVNLGEENFNSSDGNITANVVITINGKSRKTELDIGWHSTDEFEYHFRGSKELFMSDFEIDPPSPALGLVKVNDKITVNYNYNIQTSIISRID